MIERHIQTVLVSLVICLMAWVGKTVSDQTVAIAKLQVSVSRLETLAKDEYSRYDAHNVHAQLRAAINHLSTRVRRLEPKRP